MDFRKVPELMAEQKAAGRKDLYIEITNCLKEAYRTLSTEEEKDEFVRILSDTLDSMDPQIYEHYRALVDMYRALTRRNDVPARRPDETGAAFTYAMSMSGRYITNDCPRSEAPSAADSVIEEHGIQLQYAAARAAVFELTGAGRYCTDQAFSLILNGSPVGCTDKVVFPLFDLEPDTTYTLTAVPDPEARESAGRSVTFRTPAEFVTINVRELGAKGDGVRDDTPFIQAAIMACPRDSRVLIPEGEYAVTSLFLKSDISIELAEGASLRAITDRTRFAHFPGCIESTDRTTEYHTGTWEGNPLPMYAGIICGINVSNVNIYGRGVIDGCASEDNWWKNPKSMDTAFRPRLVFLNHCDHINFMGITLTNSPSWTIHPFYSDNLGFYNITEINPADSPNTDGLDPESCRNIKVLGVHFSLGDDCIAIKSGKIYMGSKYHRASENLEIRHCLMENGHGAVTVGSEMSGGVKNVLVEDCIFRHTDRGLRIKTRRGRGRNAVVDNITFRRIDMDGVMTPFVVNCFYFCDPDGRTPYVQSRDLYPVDDGTPYVGTLTFTDINAVNCHAAAAFFDGLPEQKIEQITIENCSVIFADECRPGVPAMTEGPVQCTRQGIFARNIKTLTLKNVRIEGHSGNLLTAVGIDSVNR